jgi:hypothetical protein
MANPVTPRQFDSDPVKCDYVIAASYPPLSLPLLVFIDEAVRRIFSSPLFID